MNNKKTVLQNNEIEVGDATNPIEYMRRRDTDGDGVCDYIDSNGYSKINDKYREITADEYRRLQNAGFDVKRNCRQSAKNSDSYILRYSDNQKAEIDTILKPVLRHRISK